MDFTVGSLVKINFRSLRELSHLISCFWNEDKSALLNNQKVLCAKDGEEVYVKEIDKYFITFRNENGPENVDFELTHIEAELAFVPREDKILSVLNMKEYPEQRFVYQLLDRCLQDCKYFVSECRNPAYLWGKTVDYHIYAMRVFYNYLNEKPEWLPISLIDFYEISMKHQVGDIYVCPQSGDSGKIDSIIFQTFYTDIINERKLAGLRVQLLNSGEQTVFTIKPTD